MRLLISIGIFLCLPMILAAQPYISQPNGFFEVTQIRGCAPLTITLDADPACNGVGCDVDFPGVNNNNDFRSLVGTSETYTYTQPGTFNLRLNRGALVDNIQITVYPNIPPAFEAYACNGSQVSLNITDTNFPRYIVNYGDGTPEVEVQRGSYSYAYGSPGARTITVRGKNIGAFDNCSSSQRTVNAIQTLSMPSINTLEIIDNSRIKLDFNIQQNVLYQLQRKDESGSFKFMKNISNIISDTIENLKTDDFYYCFKLGVIDPCTSLTPQFPPNTTICSINFDVDSLNNQNRLNWVTGAGDGLSGHNFKKDGPSTSLEAQATPKPYPDTDVTCGTRYCYQLINNYDNGSKSYSSVKCVTAFSDDEPSAIENITAIVGQSGVDLEWQPTPGFIPEEFTIIKSINGSPRELGKTTGLQISDPDYDVTQPTCYEISYKDKCGNTSPGNEACPIRLSGTLQNDNSIELFWTPYTGWKDGVNQYIVQKRTVQGQLLDTDVTANTTHPDTEAATDMANQVYVYIVRAVPNDNSLNHAVSNTHTIIKNPKIHHPTAFTPNGDGTNDLFTVKGLYITGFSMNIFNRWGELMFTTTDQEQGWDGSYRGIPMPEGTYTFVANVTDQAGRTFTRSGTVLLLKRNK